MDTGLIIGWIVMALAIGFWGDTRRIGFGGAFVLSLLLSPLIGAIIVASSKSKEDMRREFEQDQRQRESAAAGQSKDVATQLADLKKLLDDGTLTASEYEAAKAKVLS